jgi:hypothetical protein
MGSRLINEVIRLRPRLGGEEQAMRTKLIAAASVAITALAIGVLALASRGEAQQAGPPTGTLEFVQRNADLAFRLVDEAPRQTRRRAFSLGDTLISRGPLRSTEGRTVGRAQTVFVVTAARGQGADTQVSATLILDDGHIVVEGADTAKADVDTLAIVGGTGRYTGARGTLRLTAGEDTTELLITLAG